MNLFFVSYPDDGRGADLDAFVEAETAEEARSLWAEQWEMDIDDTPGLRIYRITPTGKAGILDWHSPQLDHVL